MKVILGAWVGRETADNEQEIATAVQLANAFPDTVRAIVVGNEVLLRGELPPAALDSLIQSGELPTAALASLIQRVQRETDVHVPYAAVWEFGPEHPEVAAAVDFATINILPYWGDDPG